MTDKQPDHWAELTSDEKRALVEMARGRLWWEQTMERLAWLKTLSVIIMGLALFLTWGRDALAEWLGMVGKD